MKNYIIILLLLCFSFFSLQHFAQDTLVLINGKQKTDLEFMKIQDEFIYYQKWKGDKNKIKLIAQEDVYAIYTKEGQHIITYKQDSIGFVLDEAKMFDYIEGMENAWDSYHNPYIFGVAFLASAGSGYFLGLPVGLIVPVAFPGAIAMRQPSVNKLKHIPADKAGNYYYVLGYQDVAKAKKVRSSVFGGLSGYCVGLAMNIAFMK